MLGYHAQSQGSSAGLTMCGPQGYPYNLPGQHHDMMKDRIDWSGISSMALQDLPRWASSLGTFAAAAAAAVDDGGSRLAEQMPPRAHMATAMAEPTDLARLVDIEFAAFRDEKVNHHLSYRNASEPSHLRRTMRAYRRYMSNLRTVPEERSRPARPVTSHRRADSVQEQEQKQDDSLGFRFRKVESPEGGEIIAFCKSEMAELSTNDVLAPLDHGHEGEPQMNRDWFALNERYHREYCGTRKHCYFGMLATHPDHQHQGAATMLMDELVAEADQAGVEIYCEATKSGRPLYEKYGFVVVKEIRFATAEYGMDLGEERQFVMVRAALDQDGRRCKPRSWEEALAESRLESVVSQNSSIVGAV